MDTKPTDDQIPQPADDLAESDDDVEGHSVIGALVVSGALRSRSPQEGDRARNKADEDLPPLSKPFPSLRDDRRK
jgi:hypothetical protein